MRQIDDPERLDQQSEVLPPNGPAPDETSTGPSQPDAVTASLKSALKNEAAVGVSGKPSVRNFFQRLHLRDVSHPEDDRARRRSLMTLMMSAVTFFVVVVIPICWWLDLLEAGDWWAALAVLVSIGAAYLFNRLRQVRVSAYVFLAGVGVSLVLRGALNSATNLTNLVFNYFALAIVVTLAGLVVDEIAPFIIATLSVIAFSLIFLNRGNGAGSDTLLKLQALIHGGVFLYIMAIMSWANARANNRALSRMAWQNSQLQKVNSQLEKNLNLDAAVGDTISQLSGDLLEISHDQSERAHSQAQSVAIVTSTLEELSATARQIAEVAESVFTATEQALRTAEAGGQSVGLGIDSIATLTAQVESISNIANELGSQSRRISEIVETITELAEETNLLALNATIEAAGAGEYGRRFAVVASEVQLLANRSRAASKDVQTILGQIRTSINNTLQATDEGLNEARRMSEVASQAGEAIEQIIETVESTTFLSRQIHLTTQQQRSATDQAVEMIRQVAGDSREAALRAQQLLSASDRLSQTATSLRQE